MADSAMVVDARLEDDLSDEDPDMDVCESFQAGAGPGRTALDEIEAAGAADLYDYGDGDEDVVNYEDPYLQGLLGPADYD